MNQKLTRLSQRYLTALRKHLQPGAGASLRPALELGRQAVALGLDTLDLARIHEQCVVAVRRSDEASSRAQRARTRQAAIFFIEASIPIEETHQAARQTQAHLGKMRATLDQRTEELAVRDRQLQRGAGRRKVLEDDFAKRGKLHRKSLEESLELQKRLRHLTHQVMQAQENERKKISLKLQDEIAQTLLGINVRLLSLQQGHWNNTASLKNEIASTQRLVVKSARSVRRFARELDVHHPAQGDSSARRLLALTKSS